MMSFADAGRAVENRQIDAFFQSSAPAGAVTQIAETKGAYVIPFTDEEMAKIVKDYPFYYAAMMKEGVYKDVPATQMPYLTVYWVAHERVPEQAIYDITKLVFQPDINEAAERSTQAAGNSWHRTPNASSILAHRCIRGQKNIIRKPASGKSNPHT